VASAIISEKVSAWENGPVEAWENVSAAAAAFAAASKSVSEIVSRPGVPCSITSTGTGTRFSAYAALDDDISARVVSSKYLGGVAAQTQHRADWPAVPVLERIQTSTQRATPATKGLGNCPVVPAPLRMSAAGDGATAKVTRQQGKHSTGSSSSTLQNVLMSDVDTTNALTAALTDSYLTPGQRSPSPKPLQPTLAAERFERELQQLKRQQELTSAARVKAWLYPPAPAAPYGMLQQPESATSMPRPLPHVPAPVAGSAPPRLLAPTTTTAQPVLPPDLAAVPETLHRPESATSSEWTTCAERMRCCDASWRLVHIGRPPPRQCLGQCRGRYCFHATDVMSRQRTMPHRELRRRRQTLDVADTRRRLSLI